MPKQLSTNQLRFTDGSSRMKTTLNELKKKKKQKLYTRLNKLKKRK
jgi:hypothetical protein|tara:strand:- start:209 stop:346 length:138 start_codon:yes stop_codon:yes gene_type:complete